VIDENSLRTIDFPDQAGTAANYRVGSLNLMNGTISQYGLPIFIQSFITTAQLQGEDHCFGIAQPFTATTDQPILSIFWNFDDPASGPSNTSSQINPVHTFSAAGTYEVSAQIETALGTTSASLIIEVFPAVIIDQMPEDITLCNEGFDQAVFDLSNTISEVTSEPNNRTTVYRSVDDAINEVNSIDRVNSFTNESNRQSLFIKISNDNCFEILEFSIGVENCAIEIFNVLTPNQDGKNDTFYISGLRNIYLDYKLSIFNRYGQQVWEGNNNTPEWNGVATMGLGFTQEKLPTGTYFYILELNDGETEPYSGYVYLQ
jgi:gliding motility-associated-like protein